ncbi:hypothetical protein BO82DRAFT_399369 [Aspergillus uvarum CBS 121591]|uniref:S-adenosyl-L-methionine-dependent methyltransferase n=1 Tax=Aspergillus uvarum CBS 121591 TaxID=1448315 RepID=A0A319CH34_9EURO|nr:hypothetical protein BO82DRAFT_399369 [Aspergillus uvarum CBS 121591]PYH84534.1 hypothetical protein BO82DRAFT_399369 [Aspergillus uvarum CBS 121591]
MTITADSLFDDVGGSYEAAFADNGPLCAFIHQASKKLPPNSPVLDVGCSTGKPVAEILDGEESCVTSPNMNTFQPCQSYDGIRRVAQRGWALGPRRDAHSTGLLPEKCTYDPTWDCVWMIGKYWMGNYTNEVFHSEDAWARLLQAVGLVLEMMPVDHLFCPASHENYTSPEVQLFLLARNVEPQALLGPYPISIVETPTDCIDNLNVLTDRFVSKDLETLSNQIAVNGKKALVLGQGYNWSQYVGCGESQFLPEITDDLSFESDAFDVIVAPWTLDKLPSLNKAMK